MIGPGECQWACQQPHTNTHRAGEESPPSSICSDSSVLPVLVGEHLLLSLHWLAPPRTSAFLLGCNHTAAFFPDVLCDTSSGFWKYLYLHRPVFSYDVSVSIYHLFSCSILLHRLAFSPLLHDHLILCCLIAQTWDLMSISHLLIFLPLFVFPADFCRLTLVNCACVWQELLAWALTQLLEDSQLLEEAFSSLDALCFWLIYHLHLRRIELIMKNKYPRFLEGYITSCVTVS